MDILLQMSKFTTLYALMIQKSESFVSNEPIGLKNYSSKIKIYAHLTEQSIHYETIKIIKENNVI